MALIKNTMKMYIIGHQRFRFNGIESFKLHCIDDFEASEDSIGDSARLIVAPYSESEKLKGVKMGLFSPAVIEFVPTTRTTSNRTVLCAEEIISIKPFIAPAAPPAPDAKQK